MQFAEYVYSDRLGSVSFDDRAALNRLAVLFGLKRLEVLTSPDVDLSLLGESTLAAELAGMVDDARARYAAHVVLGRVVFKILKNSSCAFCMQRFHRCCA